MSTQETTLQPFATLDLENGAYRIGYDTGSRGTCTASVRLPRETVEAAVLEALLVELEMRTDGTLVAVTAASDEPLATVALSALVAAALEPNPVDAEDDPAELQCLEAELERALRAVRGAREARTRR